MLPLCEAEIAFHHDYYWNISVLKKMVLYSIIYILKVDLSTVCCMEWANGGDIQASQAYPR